MFSDFNFGLYMIDKWTCKNMYACCNVILETEFDDMLDCIENV